MEKETIKKVISWIVGILMFISIGFSGGDVSSSGEFNPVKIIINIVINIFNGDTTETTDDSPEQDNSKNGSCNNDESLHRTIEILGESYVTKADLESLFDTGGFEAVRILRNYAYARHGYAFNHGNLRKYFDAYSWYEPLYQDEFDASAYFSGREYANVERIVEWERSHGSPYQ